MSSWAPHSVILMAWIKDGAICVWREVHEHSREPGREETGLVILPTSNGKAAGGGDRVAFKNGIAASGTYQDLADGDEGEVEVNPKFKTQGKGQYHQTEF